MTAISVPGIGLFPACTRKESRQVPYLGLGLEFNLVSGRWGLGRKKPSGYLHRAGPLVATDRLCVKGIRGEVS